MNMENTLLVIVSHSYSLGVFPLPSCLSLQHFVSQENSYQFLSVQYSFLHDQDYNHSKEVIQTTEQHGLQHYSKHQPVTF